MIVHIEPSREALKLRYILEAFFDDLVWDQQADMLIGEDGIHFNQAFHPFRKQRAQEDLFLFLLELTGKKPEWGLLFGVRPLKIVHRQMDLGFDASAIRQGLLDQDHISENKADLLLEIAENQRELYLSHRDQIALYLSIPFCPSICSYCHFNTRIYRSKQADHYVDLLEEQLQMLKQERLPMDILYLGGGTPSALSTEQLRRLKNLLQVFPPFREITIEAGRIDSFTEEKAELLQWASRICVNPQSFDEKVLRLAGRKPVEAFEYWVDYFESRGIIVNSDLIAGLPGESVRSFSDSLSRVIRSGARNVTLHNLSLKKGARLPGEVHQYPDAQAMLEMGYQMLRDAGYRPYYIYRQKNMLGRGENVAWEKENTPCHYNVRMMEDAHWILSLGANAVSKVFEGQILKRLQTIKDPAHYMQDREHRERQFQRFIQYWRGRSRL